MAIRPNLVRTIQQAPHEAAQGGGSPIEVRCTAEQAGTLVQVNGDVDHDCVQPLRDALSAFPRSPTIVDLSAVTFADCALLNALLEARRTVGNLVLAGPVPERVRRLFDLTGTLAVFIFSADLSSARTVLRATEIGPQEQRPPFPAT